MANTTVYTTFKLNDLVSAGLSKIDGNMSKLDGAFEKTDAASKSIFDKLGGSMKNFQLKNMEALQGITAEIPGATAALELLANPYALAAAAAVAFGAAAIDASKEWNSFDKSMHKVNTTAQLSEENLQKLNDRVLEVGKDSLTPMAEIPDALNKIMSAGITNVNQAMATLDPTLKAASAGSTDVETTAGAAVSVMKSAGIEDANKAYDVLFATVREGNAEFKDIANYLPKIIPGAQAAGFSLEQTAGAYAYLTAQGQTAERSTTLLENTFKALADSDNTSKFKKLGVNIYDAGGKMNSLVSIAGQLDKKLAGRSDQSRAGWLGSLGLDSEAQGGLLALMKNLDGLKATTDAVTNSQGALNEAVKNAASGGDVWVKLSNRMNYYWLKFGEAVAPTFNAIGKGLLYAFDAADKVFNLFVKGTKDLYYSSTTFKTVFDTVKTAADTVGTAIAVVWETASRYISQTYTNTMVYISAFDKISQYFTGNSLFENLDKFFTGVMKRIQSVFEMTEAVVKTLKGLYSGDFSGAKDAAFRAATHYTGGSTDDEKRNNAISDIEYRVGRGDKKEDIFDYIAKKVDKKGQAYATAKAEEMLRGRTSLLPSNDKKVGAGGNPLLTDLPTGKSQKDKGAAAGERGNNVRNVQITIQRIVGAEVVNIYGTDPNLTGLQRMVEQHTTEAIVRGVRDTEIVLPNQ